MDNTAAVTGAASAGSSVQTIAVLVLFIAVLACLPWLLRRWQQRQMISKGHQAISTKVLSATPLAPGQRIVVVEIEQGGQPTRLVLGVTQQNIQCLHVMPAAVDSGAAPAPSTSFASTMQQVQSPQASNDALRGPL